MRSFFTSARAHQHVVLLSYKLLIFATESLFSRQRGRYRGVTVPGRGERREQMAVREKQMIKEDEWQTRRDLATPSGGFAGIVSILFLNVPHVFRTTDVLLFSLGSRKLYLSCLLSCKSRLSKECFIIKPCFWSPVLLPTCVFAHWRQSFVDSVTLWNPDLLSAPTERGRWEDLRVEPLPDNYPSCHALSSSR